MITIFRKSLIIPELLNQFYLYLKRQKSHPSQIRTQNFKFLAAVVPEKMKLKLVSFFSEQSLRVLDKAK